MKYFASEKIQKSLSNLDDDKLQIATGKIINNGIIAAKSNITKARLVFIAICIRNEELSRKKIGLTTWQ
jgi:hypothetical protein